MNAKYRVIAIWLAISVLVVGCGQGQPGSAPSSGPKSRLLTAAQISSLKLDDLLLKPGDLPKDFTGAAPTDTVPERYKVLPAAKYKISKPIEAYGSWSGDVTVFLYDKQADIDGAVKAYASTSTPTEIIPGTEFKFDFTPFSIPYSGGTIDGAFAFFVMCSAVVDVRIITPNNGDVSAYAKLLGARLAPVVCSK
jgi:hypothetical protein